MALFLVAVAAVAGALSNVLLNAFANNPVLNSVILAVLLLGIAWNVRMVVRLSSEVTWLQTFQVARSKLPEAPLPHLLAPMASMLSAREGRTREGAGRFTLSA